LIICLPLIASPAQHARDVFAERQDAAATGKCPSGQGGDQDNTIMQKRGRSP
jgi:hypothetical protein